MSEAEKDLYDDRETAIRRLLEERELIKQAQIDRLLTNMLDEIEDERRRKARSSKTEATAEVDEGDGEPEPSVRMCRRVVCLSQCTIAVVSGKCVHSLCTVLCVSLITHKGFS